MFLIKGNIAGTYTGPLILPPQVCIVGIGRMQALPRYVKSHSKKNPEKLEIQPRNIVKNMNYPAYFSINFRSILALDVIIESWMEPQ